MADGGENTSPVGEICEVNAYFFCLLPQIECAFSFLHMYFLYLFIKFHLQMLFLFVWNENASEKATAQ